jgi:putative transposase
VLPVGTKYEAENAVVSNARFLINEKSGPSKRRYGEEVLDSLKRIMDENLYNGTDMPYKWIYREYKKSIRAVNELRDINDQIIIRSFQTIWRIIKEKGTFINSKKQERDM